MEQIVVKTEVQPNGEILLFYVDEHAVDGTEGRILHLEEGTDYEVMDASAIESVAEVEQHSTEDAAVEAKGNIIITQDIWSDEDLQKLLVFYVDNKETFANKFTEDQHLWAVACRTMLVGRSPESCEVQLRILKQKYAHHYVEQQKGYSVTWPLFSLCYQAFHDDSYVDLLLKDVDQKQVVSKITVSLPATEEQPVNGGIMVVKNMDKNGDDKVETMLQLYLRYKKNLQNEFSSKTLWETIAFELGDENAEYWHKRFMNFKQHYLRMLAKRAVDGPTSINWRYMDLFDQIFGDDPVFQNKYVNSNNLKTAVEMETVNNDEWNDAECIILVKYYFDCFEEFEDATIPNDFLWNEVGRLVDKKPDICKRKYKELYNAHFDKYSDGMYDLNNRIPLEIVLDNIISKEVQGEMSKEKNRYSDNWSTDELDVLVKFVYNNLELFKDSVCYYVCWSCISRTLKKDILSCKKQWEELKMLYKSILSDKMENPDLEIDWRYIELFDRIFDYGTDTELLNDFEKIKNEQLSLKVGAHKVKINLEEESYENNSDDEEFDERGFTKRNKRPFGDSKAFKILEFYQKNKDKFSTTQRKKLAFWEILAKQIGMTGEQCAHRFRNLKQVYTGYVEREVNKPEMPILWPYYALCKKVFGYRAIKSKIKNSKYESSEIEEWTAKDIRQLINYYGVHFDDFSTSEELSKWRDLAIEMKKSESTIRDKFNELRKSYRRLQTVKDRNPQFKVSWKYFNMFEEIYSRSNSNIETLEMDDEVYETVEELNEEDEDYECIIVLPEGGDLNDLSDVQVIMKNNSEATENTEAVEQVVETVEPKTSTTAWTKKSKRRLLVLYHNYVRARRGQEINPKEMWSEIASKLPSKTPISCKKMFAKLKFNHMKIKNSDEAEKKNSPYQKILEKILTLKPKFPKSNQGTKDDKTYKDVLLPANKVELALQYYLQHIEEFSSPRFEKKYLWTELANFVAEPINKLFNKINYLKQNYNLEKNEVAGEATLFGELLKDIVVKEKAIKEVSTPSVPVIDNDEVVWSDDEIEQLLIWYLANLEKFKNPKYVRKYLWLEASSILTKSPLACSKKMTEVRTQYKTMIKENPDELTNWRFYGLCQKIYGTGRKAGSIQ